MQYLLNHGRNKMEKKTLAAPFDGLYIGSESEVISNPYSGESVLLDPLAVAVYDTIKGAEATENYSMVRKGLEWFRKNYPEEYMVLLD
jgi:hypothetical protein